MSEEDFVFAWLIALRAGGDGPWGGTPFHIIEAKEIYQQIKESCNEANSRTED